MTIALWITLVVGGTLLAILSGIFGGFLYVAIARYEYNRGRKEAQVK